MESSKTTNAAEQIDEIKALNLLLEDAKVDMVLHNSDGEEIDAFKVHAVDGRVTNQLANILYDAGYRRQRMGEWQIKSETIQMLDDVDEELYVECPFCKRRFWVPYELYDEKIFEYAREHYPYCNCGAKMEGGKNEDIDDSENKPTKIIVTDIKWDAPTSANLPTKVVIDLTDGNKHLLEDINGYAENISDYLSDTFEYCHTGFNVTVE